MKLDIILFGLITFALLSLTFVSASWSSVNLTDGTSNYTSENLTLTGNQNITRYLSIPQNTILTNAVMNLSGYKLFGGFGFVNSITLNESNTRGIGICGNSTNLFVVDSSDDLIYVYDKEGNYKTIFALNTTNNDPMDCYTNNSFIWVTEGGTGIQYVFKYDMSGSYVSAFSIDAEINDPDGITSNGTVIFVLQGLTGVAYHYDMEGNYLGAYTTFSSVESGMEYYNERIYGLDENYIREFLVNGTYTGSSYELIGNVNYKHSVYIDGEYSYIGHSNLENSNIIDKYAFNTTPTNPSLSINNSQTWNYTGQFNQTNNRTNNFASIVNSYLSTCAYSNGYCLVPFIFHSDTVGILEYLDMLFAGIWSIPPAIVIQQPQPQTYAINDSIPLNFTAYSDINISSCWFNVKNATGYKIANTTIVGCNNTNFSLPHTDVPYVLTLYANDTDGNLNSSNVSFALSFSFPSVVLNYPTSNLQLGSGVTVYFNFTGTHSSGLDTCQLWTNKTGTWQNSYSWVNPTNATMNYTTLNTWADGTYLWNVKCNVTGGAVGWGLNNLTFGIDTQPPIINMTSISTTQGSTIFSVLASEVDPNLASCKYSIYNSTNGIDSGSVNKSFTCNSIFLASASSLGDYSIVLYSNDTLGHEANISAPFTLSPIPAPPGGGGYAPIQEITNETIAPNLEDNLFGWLSTSAFVWNGWNITWFVLGMGIIAIFIIAYSYKNKGGLKVGR